MATTQKISIGGAIASILGKTKHEDYIDIGLKMTAKDLAKQLGLTSTPMLYHYMNGKTSTVTPDRAYLLARKFNLIVGDYNTIDEIADVAKAGNKAQEMVKMSNRPIVEEIILAEKIKDVINMKIALRKIIVRYY